MKMSMKSYGSWEERAFAGGPMWLPRSYTCGFCRREFRSAQALGGHMNVHRKDRALLSRSLASPRERLLGMQVSRVEDSVGFKRPRLDVDVDVPSSMVKPCLGSMEELDLELRLGCDPPQVK